MSSTATAAATAVPAAKTTGSVSEKKRKVPDAELSAAGTPSFPQMSKPGQANRTVKVPRKPVVSKKMQELLDVVKDVEGKIAANDDKVQPLMEVPEFKQAFDAYCYYRGAKDFWLAQKKIMEQCKSYLKYEREQTAQNNQYPELPSKTMFDMSRFGQELDRELEEAKANLVQQKTKEDKAAAEKAAAKEAAEKAAAKEAADKAAADKAAAEKAAAKEAADKEASDKEAADKKAARKADKKAKKEAKEAADKEAADKEAAAKEAAAIQAEERALVERLAQLRAKMPPLEAVVVQAVLVNTEGSSTDGGSPAPKRTYTFPCRFCGDVNVGTMCKKSSCVEKRKDDLKRKKAEKYGKGSSNPNPSGSDSD